MSAIIAYLFVVGVLAAVAARGAEELLRLTRRPVRWSWAWGLALLAALAAWAPFRAPVAPAPPAALVSGVRALPEGGPGTPESLGGIAALRILATQGPERLLALVGGGSPAAGRTAGIAWGGMSLVLAALLAWSWLRLRRRALRLPEATLHDTPVRVSRDIGPAVVGLTTPAIVVPRWLLDASAEEQRLAIEHEREHLRARDHLLLLAGCGVLVLLPWHPAAWWMLARLRLAVELDCDARVLSGGVGRRRYGAALIDIASRGARLPLGVPALADHTTHLERRLIAMTPARMPFRRTRAAGVAAASALALLAACEAKLPSSPELEAMDAKAVAAHTAAKVALGPDSLVEYRIDGEAATRADAEALRAERIASVEVVKGGDRGRSAVRITTRSADSTVVLTAASASVRFSGPSRDTTHIDVGGPAKLSSRDFTGLVYIDEVKSDASALSRLAPDAIESIEVIKGSAATQRYREPAAANGVILVKLKR